MAIAPMPLTMRSMLACDDGSFLPLVAKYHESSQAPVFEVDASLCPGVQLLVKKQSSPQGYHPSPASVLKPQSYGGGQSQTVDIDYQQRIDAIVAGQREREHCIIPATNTMSSTIQHHQASSIPEGNKEYCTYWIRTGECDYIQQGCRFKHEMPSLDKLKDIGFTRGYPKWWQEKVQYARPPVSISIGGVDNAERGKRDMTAIKRIVNAQLGAQAHRGESAISSDRGSTSGSDIEETGKPISAVRKRIAAISSPSDKAPERPQTNVAIAAKTEGQSQAPIKVLKPQHRQPADLLDFISDSESDTLQPALQAPHNSPEAGQVSREGRFIPHNEPISGASNSPARSNLRSPSPLLLDAQHPTRAQVNSTPTEATREARNMSTAPPVGYQGKQGPLKQNSVHATTSSYYVKGKKSADWEAEVRAFGPHSIATKDNAGLSKSRFANHLSKPPMQKDTEIHRKRRFRNRSHEQQPKKACAKALHGLQLSKEDAGKDKENVSTAKESMAVPTHQANARYRHLFAESE